MGRKLNIVLLTLLILSIWTIGNAQLYCMLCGKEIAGTYYKSGDGKTYCEQCWRSNSVCSLCGRLTRSAVTVDGRKICPACYSELDVCSYCSKPLVGTYTQYPTLNIKICQQCEQTLSRCSNCGIPVKEPISFGNTILCERCIKKVERCTSCGEPLLQDYSFFEGNNTLKYCFACISKYPRCDNCGAPSGANGTALDDGRHLCPECRKVAIFDAGLIDPIRQKVAAFVSQNLGMNIKHDIKFLIKDRKFLQEKAADIDLHGDLNGLFYRKGNDYYIYILYGLREKDMISVIAHEIAHAWQAENSPDNMQLEDQEGFSQWVAFKALKHFALDDFAALMTEGDSVYARGLLKMLKLEKVRGSSGVFEYISRKK